MQVLFRDLGQAITCPTTFAALQFEHIATVDIDPLRCGPFAVVMSSVQVKVSLGVKRTGAMVVLYEFSWSHTGGGRNGYSHRFQISPEGLISPC